MTYVSVKLKRRKSKVSGKQAPVYFQLICHRRAKRIPLDIRVYEKEWDETSQLLKVSAATTRERLDYLLKGNEGIAKTCRTLQTVISSLESKGYFTVDDIVEAYQNLTTSVRLSDYAAGQIAQLKQQKRFSTAHNYQSALNCFAKFHTPDISLTALTARLIEDYETFLKTQKIVSNTLSYYLRTLRTIWNKAMADRLIEPQPSIFRNVNTRIEKARKRAIKEESIHKIEKLTAEQLKATGLSFARDLFLFSYYARGMAFVDVAFLKKENIQGDALIYNRKKTGKQLEVKLLPEMKAIIDRYSLTDSQYLFPILKSVEPEFGEYTSALRLQNMRLADIAKLVDEALSTYVARHSWASNAYRKGVPEELIAECFGHSYVKTTRHYITSLDNSRLDRINDYVVAGKMKPNNWYD